MNTIPNALKKVLFGKNENEPLTPEEQNTWDASFLYNDDIGRTHADDLHIKSSIISHNRKIAAWKLFETNLFRMRLNPSPIIPFYNANTDLSPRLFHTCVAGFNTSLPDLERD